MTHSQRQACVSHLAHMSLIASRGTPEEDVQLTGTPVVTRPQKSPARRNYVSRAARLLGYDLGLASSLRPSPVPTLAVVGPDLGCGINTFAVFAFVCWGFV